MWVIIKFISCVYRNGMQPCIIRKSDLQIATVFCKALPDVSISFGRASCLIGRELRALPKSAPDNGLRRFTVAEHELLRQRLWARRCLVASTVRCRRPVSTMVAFLNLAGT